MNNDGLGVVLVKIPTASRKAGKIKRGKVEM